MICVLGVGLLPITAARLALGVNAAMNAALGLRADFFLATFLAAFLTTFFAAFLATFLAAFLATFLLVFFAIAQVVCFCV